MLGDFMEEQPIVCKEIINLVEYNKLSHAYIIETNGYPKSWDFCLGFVKYLLCPQNNLDNKNCKGCTQCIKIDKNEYLELKIIEADGQWIKKQQLDELQLDFSKKAIIGNKKIYIIKDAEKLNASSSNSLLKFLEEPEENIIAILMTEKKQQLLQTIVSRCQIFSLINKKEINKDTISNLGKFLFNDNASFETFITSEVTKEKIEKIIDFIIYYEKNHLNTIIYTNKLWHDYFNDRDEIYNALFIMILFYKDVLNYKITSNIEIFCNYVDKVDMVNNLNDENKLMFKINKLIEIKDYIKYNVNINMLMDKLIIELEDVI